MAPAATNEPKTSEFAFFKRLKHDVGHTSRQNPLNRTSFPVRKIRPSNNAKELGNSKLEDIKSAKKSGAGEIGSFFSLNNPPLEPTATPSPEHVNGSFKSSSLIKTPININVDSFASSTANASNNLENQQKEGDVVSSKRQKLLQQIARTLFPGTDEVPTECNLITLLLSRLLPECSQQTLSQVLPLRQSNNQEKNYSNLESNIQHKETNDTTRKVVNHNEDNFAHTSAAARFPRHMDTLPCGQTVQAIAVADDRLSNRMLFWDSEGNERGGFLTINPLMLGNELYGYSSPDRICPEILTNGPYKKFPCHSYGSVQSPLVRNRSNSCEAIDGCFDSFTASDSGSLCKIRDFISDRRQKARPNCWYDVSSPSSFKRFRPSTLSNLRDFTDRNYANDFEITRVLGWDPDILDVSNSTHNRHMELEIYCPPSSTTIQDCRNSLELDIIHPPVQLLAQNEDHWDPDNSKINDLTHAIHMELEIYRPLSSTSIQDGWDGPELDIYRSPTTQKENHWDNMENHSLMPLCPYTYNDHNVLGHHLQVKEIIPNLPFDPYKTTGSAELDLGGSSIFQNTSKSSSFVTIRQECYKYLENMCERNYSGAEAFISKDWESDFELKYKSITGFQKGQNGKLTDDRHEHYGRGNLRPQFVFDSVKQLAISHSEAHFLMSDCMHFSEEDSFSLLLDTVNWKETYGEGKSTISFE